MRRALKASWTVQTGVIPGIAIDELSRQWFYTSEDYEKDRELTDATTIFMSKRDEAVTYWTVVNDPMRLNWATIHFMWY